MLNKLLTLFVLFFMMYSTSSAQTLKISGNIADTSEKKSLANASVALLRASDSILVKHARANASGQFSIDAPSTGKYILLISYPGYASYADILDVNGNLALGNISMLTRAVMLKEVIVRGSASIRMKGDTLAFTADSFKVKEGATVEDLLRNLPGLTVNSKGEITAQGQRVEKVLVDGDEFFGDDPTLATRNIQANAVKEVQVFDKKSEQAAFTGIDDGQQQKTINLKLKDEFKRGYFGKVKLGAGNKYENQAMLNAFKDKRKLSVYGIAANTNNNALGWSEESQFGGNINRQMEMDDDGGIMMWSSGDEFGGTGGFYGEGLPTSYTLGTSYANKWNKNRSSVNGAYRFQHLQTEANSTNNTQYILPDTQYFNNQNGRNMATRWRHKASANTDIFIDSLQSITINANGSYGRNELFNQFYSEALTIKQSPVNQSKRQSSSEGMNSQFNANITWKKKFKTKGRTLSASLSQAFNDAESEGFLLTYNDFFVSGGLVKQDTVDQKKLTANTSNSLGGRVAYTEPFGKNAIVEFSYGYNHISSNQQRLSYDKNGDSYSKLNETFSNDFDFTTNTHKPGLSYAYNYKKLKLGFGSDVGFTNWKQYDKFRDTTRNYSFVNFFPKANFNYKLGQYSSVRFRYTGNTQNPTLNQLQPVADNTDPLNIYVGNPNLDIAFNHRFELGYNFYQVLKSQGLWASLWYNPTNNAFSTRDFIDSIGRRVNQTVNVDGNYSLGAWMGYNMAFKKAEMNLDVRFNPSISKVTNFVNGERNETNNTAWRFGFYSGKRKEKKYYISTNHDFAYTIAKSSIRPDVVTRYWTWNGNIDLTAELPWKLTLSNLLEYDWRQTTEVFPEPYNVFRWNIGLEKKIAKKQDMKVGFRVNDLLNQNIGFSRNANANYINERTYDVIRRFWLITFSWSFNKGPQKPEEDFSF